MRKYDFISALAKETAAEVVKNREEWMKYLTTAARLYKYPFREQLLIYAQGIQGRTGRESKTARAFPSGAWTAT